MHACDTGPCGDPPESLFEICNSVCSTVECGHRRGPRLEVCTCGPCQNNRECHDASGRCIVTCRETCDPPVRCGQVLNNVGETCDCGCYPYQVCDRDAQRCVDVRDAAAADGPPDASD